MNKRIIVVIILLISVVAFFTRCESSTSIKQDSRGEAYAGSASCVNCHKNIYNSYLQTAHYHTTALAAANTIKGSFQPTQNSFSFNDSMKVIMEKTDGGFYETAFVNGKKKESHRIDVVFGAAKSQTFLYWKDDAAYQLPISYLESIHSWVNSPNYPTDDIYFNRQVPVFCFQCHSSNINETLLDTHSLNPQKALDKNSLIVGIDCERCHGPAAQHVAYHEEHPEVKQAKYITLYTSLNRQQKLDECAVCHSGAAKQPSRSLFTFHPGDSVSNYFYPDFASFSPTNPKNIDVHGNQYQLLTSSQCFLKSTTMDCSTCHNVHTKENSMTTFNQSCINCHNTTTHSVCKLTDSIGSVINDHCVDCHMPLQESKVITFQTDKKQAKASYPLRTHYITVYPEESKKVISYLKENHLL